MNIENKVKELVKNVARQDVNIESITETTILTDDLGFDSVMIIELVVELENEFSIEIDDDDLEIDNLTIYKNLLEMITRKVCI